MNFIFDNNLPPAWPAAIALLGQDKYESHCHIGEIIHLREKFKANTPDIEWLMNLGLDKATQWTIISRDGFRKQNGAERQVQCQYGLSVFVMQKSWASKPYWSMTSQFVHWWPRLVKQACETERVAMEVPWSISGKFSQI
ncbi:PIN-like domain-containing protein [Comamonas piscis]